jgi:hypothetical protein
VFVITLAEFFVRQPLHHFCHRAVTRHSQKVTLLERGAEAIKCSSILCAMKPAHQPSDENELQSVASRACTQSGAFAMLLSVALFALVPSWLDRPKQIALSNYVGDRLNMANAIEALDADPIWQIYKASNPSAESMSIAELLRVTVARRGRTSPAVPSAKPSPPGAPSPAIGLTATAYDPLDQANVVATYLNSLNNPRMLLDSMAESNYFSFSIFRWSTKRSGLINENIVQHNCLDHVSQEIPAPGAANSDPFPPIDKNVQLGCLTLSDVRTLSAYELPAFPNSLPSTDRIQRQVDIRPGSLPADLGAATITVQLLLFFVMLYFAAFELEATASKSFPASGTLFSAFSKSKLTLSAFGVVLWVPSIASAWVSIVSRSLPIAILTLPIVLAGFGIARVLGRKGYFAPLRRV